MRKARRRSASNAGLREFRIFRRDRKDDPPICLGPERGAAAQRRVKASEFAKEADIIASSIRRIDQLAGNFAQHGFQD
jgi:hypothetical protein